MDDFKLLELISDKKIIEYLESKGYVTSNANLNISRKMGMEFLITKISKNPYAKPETFSERGLSALGVEFPFQLLTLLRYGCSRISGFGPKKDEVLLSFFDFNGVNKNMMMDVFQIMKKEEILEFPLEEADSVFVDQELYFLCKDQYGGFSLKGLEVHHLLIGTAWLIGNIFQKFTGDIERNFYFVYEFNQKNRNKRVFRDNPVVSLFLDSRQKVLDRCVEILTHNLG